MHGDIRRTLVLVITVILAPSLHAAQQIITSTPPAPIPIQISLGRKVFISYAGTNNHALVKAVTKMTGTPNGYYDQFYAGMKSWGRYELLPTPAEADLIFEISADYPRTLGNPQLRLRILDPKTQVVLWAFVEETELSLKDWNRAVSTLLNDSRALAQPPAAPAANQH